MLPTYQNILVATDFTENSDNAFRHAVLLARLHDAKIHLVHVTPDVEPVYRSSQPGQDKKMEKLRKESEQASLAKLKQLLDDFAQKELANFPADLKHFAGASVAIGNPMLKILEAAEGIKADVIVMGTHSKGVLQHAFLGSVAEKVIQRAKCPVFIIPLPKSP